MKAPCTISDSFPGRSSVPEVVREHFPTSADGACFGLTGAFTARAGNRDPGHFKRPLMRRWKAKVKRFPTPYQRPLEMPALKNDGSRCSGGGVERAAIGGGRREAAEQRFTVDALSVPHRTVSSVTMPGRPQML